MIFRSSSAYDTIFPKNKKVPQSPKYKLCGVLPGSGAGLFLTDILAIIVKEPLLESKQATVESGEAFSRILQSSGKATPVIKEEPRHAVSLLVGMP